MLKLTAGPLLRGIQAVLQELAGSATGGTGLGAGFCGQDGALRAWLPTRRPAAIQTLNCHRRELLSSSSVFVVSFGAPIHTGAPFQILKN